MNARVDPALLRKTAEEMTPDERLVAIRDHNWRISNLYKITDKDGHEVTFRPNKHQRKFYANMWWKNIVLKARQLGYSTAYQLEQLDKCLFTPNTKAAVIAQDDPSATGIFRKMEFAYERLPAELKEYRPLVRDRAQELAFSNGSSLRVATSVRSDTLQMLHVSEFGKICAKYPDKAREVLTGSLPAAERGIVCVESTAEGREGPFYEMCGKAMAGKQAGRTLSRLDFKFHFAAWWSGDEYRLAPELATVTQRDHDYFDKLEIEIGRRIDPQQRAWYVVTREQVFAGDVQMMRQEYPSTPEEAFEQSIEGVYYAEQLAAAQRQGRICDLVYDPRVPVNTFWDLGKDDDTAIWFHQKIGQFDHFIDYYEVSDAPFSTIVNAMQAKGYVWGRHYLPHDGEHRSWGVDQLKTAEDMLNDLGLRNTEIVPRTPNVSIAIRQCRDAFAKYRFDRTRCAVGINHLYHYRKKWNERLGAWADEPLKNGHQHAADALRQHSQRFADEPGVSAGSRPNPKRRASAMAV